MRKIDFPEVVRSTRFLLKEDQETFAKRFGVNPSLISLWESGKRNPSFEKAMQILDLNGKLQMCDACMGRGYKRSLTANS